MRLLKYELENTGKGPTPWKLTVTQVGKDHSIVSRSFRTVRHALMAIDLSEKVVIPLADAITATGFEVEIAEVGEAHLPLNGLKGYPEPWKAPKRN